MHELQHAIQSLEGFAPGANAGSATSALAYLGLLTAGLQRRLPPSIFTRIAPDLASRDPERITRAIQSYDLDTHAFAAQREVEQIMRNPPTAYRRMPGEIEARNVQSRQFMSPE
ncbi:hypothetical protein ATO6_14445 [Oceanicola sp. 22II-s10i]|nr:hypothetical protein ATO6_14445 [Oceanicola sp. 22II-s10i]